MKVLTQVYCSYCGELLLQDWHEEEETIHLIFMTTCRCGRTIFNYNTADYYMQIRKEVNFEFTVEIGELSNAYKVIKEIEKELIERMNKNNPEYLNYLMMQLAFKIEHDQHDDTAKALIREAIEMSILLVKRCNELDPDMGKEDSITVSDILAGEEKEQALPKKKRTRAASKEKKKGK